MLAPEVWNFAPPASSVSHKFSEFIEDVFGSIKSQYFNHFISITLPNTLEVPEDLVRVVLNDSQFYKINKVSLIDLLDEDFIDIFVKKGGLTAISIGKYSEQDDSVAFIPSGKMILSLNRKTYQELGIKGSCTNFGKKSIQKKILVLDLTSDSFKFGENLKKTWQTFPTSLQLYFDIVLAWEPYRAEVCPSSIAYYFSKKGFSVKACDVKFMQRHEYNVTVPVLDYETEPDALIEWLASFNLKCDLYSDSFISTFSNPDKHEIFGQAVHLTFVGMFTSSRVQRLITQIKKYISAKSPSSFIGLVVQGFDNSFVGVNNEKSFEFARDHHHTIIFKGNFPILICKFSQK